MLKETETVRDYKVPENNESLDNTTNPHNTFS